MRKKKEITKEKKISKFKKKILNLLNNNLKTYLNFNLNKIYISRSSRSLRLTQKVLINKK